MKRVFKETILNQPIAGLDISQEFKGVTEINGINTLAELLQRHTRDLQSLPGFSVRLIHEFIHFLEEKDLGHYIDPI